MSEPKAGFDRTLAFYTSRAQEYANGTKGLQLPDIIGLLAEHCPAGSRVLDLGSGSGRDLADLATRGYRVLGLDYNTPLAKIAQSYSRQEVVVGDFRSLPFRTDSFGVVWAIASLLHVPREECPGVLAEVNRVIQSHGFLLTSMQAGRGQEIAEDGRFYQLYGPQEWAQLLHAAGFAIRSQSQSSHVCRRGGTIDWCVTLARKART